MSSKRYEIKPLTEEQKSLVEQHMPIAGAVARDASKGRSNQISFGEALSSAAYGLMRAASRFDGSKGDFSTSGFPRARGQVSDDLRSRSRWFSYGPSKTNQTPEGFGRIADKARSNGEVARIDSEDEVEWLIKPLKSEVQKQVMRLYYLKNMTLEEIGKEMGFSESNACLMRAAALRSLKEHNKVNEHGNDL